LSVLEQQEDPVTLWLEGLEKQKTRETYAQALKRLSEVSGSSPFRMLEDARRDMKSFWVYIKADASRLKPHIRSSAISALRSYLRANGEFPPYDRLKRQRKSRTWIPRLTERQANPSIRKSGREGNFDCSKRSPNRSESGYRV
jgi:hypothetical protein